MRHSSLKIKCDTVLVSTLFYCFRVSFYNYSIDRQITLRNCKVTGAVNNSVSSMNSCFDLAQHQQTPMNWRIEMDLVNGQ